MNRDEVMRKYGHLMDKDDRDDAAISRYVESSKVSRRLGINPGENGRSEGLRYKKNAVNKFSREVRQTKDLDGMATRKLLGM